MDQNILFSPSGNTRLRLGSGALPGRNTASSGNIIPFPCPGNTRGSGFCSTFRCVCYGCLDRRAAAGTALCAAPV